MDNRGGMVSSKMSDWSVSTICWLDLRKSLRVIYLMDRGVGSSKSLGLDNASVHQVDNSKGLSEVQPAYGANRPVSHLGAYHAAPVVHHAPAYHAPIVHAAPVYHAAPAYHAP